MANIASQKKRNRQNEKRRVRNVAVRSELKTRVKVARQAVTDGAEDAPEGIFSMSGEQPGLSLRMRIFGRDGGKHFESYGGLDFLQEARVSGWRFYMEVRPDLLADRAILREGVQLALTPYVPEPAPAEAE